MPNDDKLVSYIQDAYAMEHAAIETLQRHAEQAKDFPNVQAKLVEHLAQTREHRDRLGHCLAAHGQEPSSVKTTISTWAGAAVGALSGMRPDLVAMNARDEYVNEHLEIASYAMLMATARAYGDEGTVDAARRNLRDEVAMGEWLGAHIAEIGLLSLQDNNISIPDSAWQFARTIAPLLDGGRVGDSDDTPGRNDAAIKADAQDSSPVEGGQGVVGVDW